MAEAVGNFQINGVKIMRDGEKEKHGNRHHGHSKHGDHHHGGGLDHHGKKFKTNEQHDHDSSSNADQKTGKGGSKAFVDANRCTGCGKCVRICPEDAISLIG